MTHAMSASQPPRHHVPLTTSCPARNAGTTQACAGTGAHMLRLRHMPTAASRHGAGTRARQDPRQRHRHQGGPLPYTALHRVFWRAYCSTEAATVWQSAEVTVAEVKHALGVQQLVSADPPQGKSISDSSSYCTFE